MPTQIPIPGCLAAVAALVLALVPIAVLLAWGLS